jgi:DNA mismatch repair protein MutS2
MAQSGLPVAAREVELPLYRQVRADVGDHQSIAADLSTFSAHVRAVAAAVSRPEPPALFLFDEIGSGTEPTEGAALARSVLESLVRPGVTAMATTHLGPLKAWAVTAEGASCAAMDFDSETLTPTYRVVMGMAGRSGGLDIAERLGLDPAIVGRARELLDPEVREGEDYLRRLRGALADAEGQVEQARRERHELSVERTRFEERREKEAARTRREADAALSRALAEFRRMARNELAGLQDPRERERAERRRVRSERRLDAARVRQRSSLPGAELPDVSGAGEAVDPERLVPDQLVWVARLGREGRVREVHADEVEVQLGSVTFRVSVADLRLPREGASAARPRREPEVRLAGCVEARSSPRELVLIGQRVEEALEALDRFLDAARLAGHEEVRIVHGHGTGRLRKAVRAFLEDHALVRGRRPGRAAEGGDGATVVTLG